MPHRVSVLDSTGAAANLVTVAGTGATPTQIPVVGSLIAIANLTYTPQGSAIDAVPTFAFRAPLVEWRNLAADIGTQIRVEDVDTNVEVVRGPVTAISRTVDAKGAAWADVSCDDLGQELVRESATSGFATADGEALGITLARLVGLSLGPAWSATNVDIGAAFDGVSFTCTGRSVLQAISDLKEARFAHFRRGAGRTIEFGRFGTASGLRIAAPQPDATAATEENAVNGWVAPLQIIGTPSFKRDGHVTNSLTLTGAGSGTGQLSLRTLYNATGETVVPTADGRDVGMRQTGPINFTAYDPGHPIRRRPAANAATFDGYDYLIEDDTSISRYGRWSNTLANADIGPVVSSSGAVSAVDEAAAAQALYVWGLSQLLWSAAPTTELSVTTDAPGDLRNLGGLKIRLQYSGAAENIGDPNQTQLESIHYDDDFIVQSLAIAEGSEGAKTAQWTLTTNGRYVRSTTSLMLDAIDQATRMGTAVQTYPMSKPIPKSQNIGAGADLNVRIPADNSVVRRHWAILYLVLEGMTHTRSDTGHTQDVITAPTNHDIGDLNHDVNAIPHDVNQLAVQILSGGLPVSTYDPATTIHIAGGAPPGGAQQLYYDPVGKFFYLSGGGASHEAPTASTVLSIGSSHTVSTAGGTGGTVKATTGATTGSGQVGGVVPKTTGGTAGKTVQATHKVAAGFGAQSVQATQELVYRGPAPTGVTVVIDGVQRFGPYNSSPAPLDITAYVGGQGEHTVTIKSPTNGAADVLIDIRDDVAPIAVRPTG